MTAGYNDTANQMLDYSAIASTGDTNATMGDSCDTKLGNVTMGDSCDTKLGNVWSPDTRERQRRYLEAYRLEPTVSRAARLSGVHRATVYRWLADPAFAEAMRRAAEVYFERHRARVLAEESAREQWRRDRERQRWDLRCLCLARAREAKRRQG